MDTGCDIINNKNINKFKNKTTTTTTANGLDNQHTARSLASTQQGRQPMLWSLQRWPADRVDNGDEGERIRCRVLGNAVEHWWNVGNSDTSVSLVKEEQSSGKALRE